MSFEQGSNEKYAEEKKKKRSEVEKRDQFWLEKKIFSETSSLLHDLASKISEEFGIDISKVKELIKGDTLGDIDGLKSQVVGNKTIDYSRLQSLLQNAHSSIEDLSKKHREVLKASLEKDQYTPEKHEYMSSRSIFPQSIIKKAENPQNTGDQLIGLGIGIIDSSEAIIIFSYSVGKGILLTPYHLYLILTGQNSYEGFSRI